MAPNNEGSPPGETAGFKVAAGDGVQVNDAAVSQALTGGVSEFPPPPYPGKTKAGGYRFELDIERMHQSDTWAIAEARQRPFLLMVWVVSWMQLPAGSLPDSDAVIAARIGMPLSEFKAGKDVLLRGWWKASDGRLYHPVVTEQVLDMVKRKARKAVNQATYRKRQRGEDEGDAEVTGHPEATDPEVTGHPVVTDCTTTTTTTTKEQEQKHLHGAEAPRRRNGESDGDDVAVPTDTGTGILIPLKDGSEYAVTGAEVAEWKAAYPDRDVPGELRKARAWCIANPDKRKTRKGVVRFLNGWLSRTADANAPPGRRNSIDDHFERTAEKFANYNGPTVSLL